jgi:hypothetical protein
VEQLSDFDQLQLRFRDPIQRRYEIIRPVLLDECTAAERAAHTHLHPNTIGKLKRRFEQQGMLGLFPAHVDMRTRERRRQVPTAAVEELQRLKGLYGGFHYRELGRIIYYKTGGSCTPSLRIIGTASKPGKMPPSHYMLEGAMPWCRIFFSIN